MGDFILSRVHAFRHAYRGCCYVIRTQKNAWIHAVFTSLVILLGLWLGLSAWEWAVLFITIGMVWVAEALNTAIETIVDLASPERHPLAKISKDVGAASVLIAAITSVVVGLLILGPPLWANMSGWVGH
jgi:diacylglycerol kinase (ATP)